MTSNAGADYRPSAASRPVNLAPDTVSRLAGLGVAGGMLACLWYWFVVANRYHIFLYQHVDAPWHGPAQPFDSITSSRYWMAPFLAAGLCSLSLLAVGTGYRQVTRQRGAWPPRVAIGAAWPPGALLLLVAVPAIVCTQNWPTLPWRPALSVMLTAQIGLVLALLPVDLMVSDPRRLRWLAADGLGLVPTLLFWRVVELPALGMMATTTAFVVAATSVGASLAWLGAMTWLGWRWQGPVPGPGSLLVAAAWWVLLFVPVVHHLMFAPAEYRYITSAQNLVGYSAATAVSAAAIAYAEAWWTCYLRRSR